MQKNGVRPERASRYGGIGATRNGRAGRATVAPRRHVVANPAADKRFCEAVDRLAKEAAWPEDLEDALFTEYPKVHVDESVLASGEVRWYACRDGRWVSPFRER